MGWDARQEGEGCEGKKSREYSPAGPTRGYIDNDARVTSGAVWHGKARLRLRLARESQARRRTSKHRTSQLSSAKVSLESDLQ